MKKDNQPDFNYFDVIVIGTGTAGSTVAHKLARSGLNVLIVEKDEIGGTCALRGCDPKKIMVSVIKTFNQIKKYENKGLRGNVEISWKDLINFKNQWTNPFPAKSLNRYEKANIKLIKGEAKFVANNTIKINNRIFNAKKIVIATGSKPMEINIPGEEYTLTNKEFFDLETLPDDITFIGGGYIAMEFAHMVARTGTQVTIVHMGQIPLENFDGFLVKNLVEYSKKIGIKFVLSHQAIAIEKKKDGFVVKAKNLKTSEIVDIKTSLVIKAAGRVPDINNLNLENANISYNKRGIKVNDYLQSVSNPDIYAAGDCAFSKGLPLTPVAETEAHIVAKNIIENNTIKVIYKEIPTVTFTIPPIASVGYSIKQLQEMDINFIEKKGIVPDWFNALRLNEKVYGFRVFIEKKSNRILGANLIGPEADEIINLFAFAINNKMTVKDIKTTIFAYPTFSSDVPYMV